MVHQVLSALHYKYKGCVRVGNPGVASTVIRLVLGAKWVFVTSVVQGIWLVDVFLTAQEEYWAEVLPIQKIPGPEDFWSMQLEVQTSYLILVTVILAGKSVMKNWPPRVKVWVVLVAPSCRVPPVVFGPTAKSGSCNAPCEAAQAGIVALEITAGAAQAAPFTKVLRLG